MAKIPKNPLHEVSYLRIVTLFKELRKKNDINQVDIESKENVGHGRISNFENLKYSPRLITFIKWCRSAGISIDLRLRRTEKPSQIIDEINKEKQQQQ